MKYKKSYVILLRNEIHEFMERLAQIKKLSEKDKVWDIVVVGGGATGLGLSLIHILRISGYNVPYSR